MPVTLTSGHKTNLTNLMSDLTTAIDSLSSTSGADQAGVKALLNKFRTELTELLKNERTQ